MGIKRSASTYARAVHECVSEFGVGAVPILMRAAQAHATFEISPRDFFLNAMHTRPAAAWRDYLKMQPRFARLLKTVNLAGGGRAFYRDKLAAEVRCLAAGIPTVSTLAVVGRAGPAPGEGGPPIINSLGPLADLLASPSIPDRLFVKPGGEYGGHGVMAPVRRGGGWQVGEAFWTNAELAAQLLAGGFKKGYLLQDRAVSHPELAPLGGQFGLSSIRVNVALTHDGPKMMIGGYKLLAYESLTDNLHSGVSGHLLVRLDEATGSFDCAFAKKPGRKFVFSRFDRHPATGAPIQGRQLSFAADIFALSRKVAATFSEAPLLAIDIAATDQGVKLVEINQFWNPYITQLLSGRGILDHMREILPLLAVSAKTRRDAEAILRGEFA